MNKILKIWNSFSCSVRILIFRPLYIRLYFFTMPIKLIPFLAEPRQVHFFSNITRALKLTQTWERRNGFWEMCFGRNYYQRFRFQIKKKAWCCSNWSLSILECFMSSESSNIDLTLLRKNWRRRFEMGLDSIKFGLKSMRVTIDGSTKI